MRLIVALILLSAANAIAASTSAVKYFDRPADWYGSDEGKRITENVLSWQAPEGGWPSNVDTAAKSATDRSKLHSTFDNKSTTDELRYLARAFVATKDPRCKEAFLKGLDYILKAQYPNGGWPQSFPLPGKYHNHITFNDGAMARLMFFLKEVATEDRYDFVEESQRKACKHAWDRGVECILKCQITVDGKLTAWCAQHDEKDFSPRPARAFELVSLSGSETVGIVHILMSIDNPSPEVIRSVDAAIAWLDSAKIPGIRVEDKPSAKSSKGFERTVVEDPSAKPMWARFYEVGTNKPIFSDRDSVRKYKLSDIGEERRNGYSWLGYYPANLIAKEYPVWKAKHSSPAATQAAK